MAHEPEESDAAIWDERYRRASQVWSGQPNGPLVSEIEGVAPGRALDVGCGEGADAIWLAGHGWQVSGLDVSEVALRRARSAGQRAGLEVQWIHAGLLEAQLAPATFDLVSAQYPVLVRTADQVAERALLAAVAPGGHLLVVHHLLDDAAIERAKAHGCDPTVCVSPADVADLLDGGWEVEVNGRRPRQVRSGAGAHHDHDVILHARRCD